MGEGKKIIVELGPGRHKRGNIGLDLKKAPGVDVICDLSRGIPLRDDSCDEIFAAHFLEHVQDPFFVLSEIHRVTKAGGKIYIRVPHWTFWGLFSLDVLFAESGSLQSRRMFHILSRRVRLFSPFQWCNRLIHGPLENFSNNHPMFYELYLHRVLPGYEVVFEIQPLKNPA